MEILLKDISDQGLDIAYEEEPRLLDLLDEDVGFEEKIAIRGRLSKTGETVSLSGWLTARLILACSRCAKDFTFPLYLELTTQFLPLVQAATTRPGEGLQDVDVTEEDYLHFYRGQSVFLDDFIREEVILAIPMQPLCDPNCKGLCSRCGQDLNIAACGCPQEEAASPLNRSVENNKKKMV
jgi:uncharacterized protein